MQGHTEAIGELGTLYRFGRGITQSYVKAAELHVIAALEGDATSIGNLSDYYPEIEKAALRGSMLAALCLAKMYDNALAVEKDKAKVLAWLRWGKASGSHDADDDVREDLNDMEAFYSALASVAVQTRAEALLAEMNRKRGGHTLRYKNRDLSGVDETSADEATHSGRTMELLAHSERTQHATRGDAITTITLNYRCQ